MDTRFLADFFPPLFSGEGFTQISKNHAVLKIEKSFGIFSNKE